MRRRAVAGLVAAVVIVTTLCSGAPGASAATDPPRVIVIGDSLVARGTSEIWDALHAAGYEPLVFGLDGESLGDPHTQARLADAVQDPRAVTVVWATAANDNIDNAEAHPLIAEAAYQGLIAWSFANLSNRCLVAVDVHDSGNPLYRSEFAATTNRWLDAAWRGRRGNVVEWSRSALGNPDWFLVDGLHLTSAGNEAYAASIVEGVRRCSAPFGEVRRVQNRVGAVRVHGWAIDPDLATSGARVAVSIGGQSPVTVRSNLADPATGAAFPHHPADVGFDITLPTADFGMQSVCVTALNDGNGAAVRLGCTDVWVSDPSAPFSDVGEDHPFRSAITELVGLGVVEGHPDGTFRPAAPLTRQALIAFLWRLEGSPAPVGRPPFRDVPAGHQFADAIAWAAEAGVTTGYPDGTFRPGATTTRQAMLAFLWRAAGEAEVGTAATFADVDATHPFASAIAWAAEVGVSTGYTDGTFRPAAALTRQASAAFLWRHHTLDAPTPPPVEAPA